MEHPQTLSPKPWPKPPENPKYAKKTSSHAPVGVAQINLSFRVTNNCIIMWMKETFFSGCKCGRDFENYASRWIWRIIASIRVWGFLGGLQFKAAVFGAWVLRQNQVQKFDLGEWNLRNSQDWDWLSWPTNTCKNLWRSWTLLLQHSLHPHTTAECHNTRPFTACPCTRARSTHLASSIIRSTCRRGWAESSRATSFLHDQQHHHQHQKHLHQQQHHQQHESRHHHDHQHHHHGHALAQPTKQWRLSNSKIRARNTERAAEMERQNRKTKKQSLSSRRSCCSRSSS